MCGIAGYTDFEQPVDERVLRRMEEALEHRGPDEGNVWRDEACGFAHRRLRVIDLSPAAAQPMTNEDGRLRIVFNGEIYNFQPLREQLVGLGHEFRSRSDTEVLLHGYESWGSGVFEKLRGMFALAVWDQSAQQLILARDRLGKKPLFYTTSARRLVFGSELPVFQCLSDLTLSVCAGSFREYLEFGYVQSPRTILRQVQRLPAGHYAIFNKRGLHLEPFWSLSTQPPATRPHGGPTEAAAALEEPLRDAVACRLVSDVPLGCFLSGGVDSTLVTALAQECMSDRLKTYTVGFASSGMNEAGHAAKVARHLNTDHHELIVDPASVLAEFETILAKTSEPIGDDSFVPTYLISRETRRHVTVALSGDGGDELFAGYAKYKQFQLARRLQRWLPVPWRSLAKLPISDRWKKSAEAASTTSARELARWLSTLWKRNEIPSLLGPSLAGDLAPDAFDRRWAVRAGFADVERWMLADMETYLEGDILPKVDRASMAVSLEGRSPFLDHVLIEKALEWTCHAQVTNGGKDILRCMLAKRLPEELFVRPKQGFGMPIEQWYRGALRDVLLRYTDPDRSKKRGLLNPKALARAVDLHLSGKRNWARKLHAIVAFEIWADDFFGCGTTLA